MINTSESTPQKDRAGQKDSACQNKAFSSNQGSDADDETLVSSEFSNNDVSNSTSESKSKSNKKGLKKADNNSQKIVVDENYQTELCKNFETSQKCKYGPKCKFAHGKNELSGKKVENKPYKIIECDNFFKEGVCNYGTRCHFQHDNQVTVNERINQNYHYQKLLNYELFETIAPVPTSRRLPIFKDLTKENQQQLKLTNATYESIQEPQKVIESQQVEEQIKICQSNYTIPILDNHSENLSPLFMKQRPIACY